MLSKASLTDSILGSRSALLRNLNDQERKTAMCKHMSIISLSFFSPQALRRREAANSPKIISRIGCTCAKYVPST